MSSSAALNDDHKLVNLFDRAFYDNSLSLAKQAFQIYIRYQESGLYQSILLNLTYITKTALELLIIQMMLIKLISHEETNSCVIKNS